MAIRSLFRKTRKPLHGRRRGYRPSLKMLENRITPTVIFHPYFGAEATTFGTGAKLNSPPIELIFWGHTYWNNPSGASASTIANKVSTMMGSPIWQNLSQYGAGGYPYLANWWIDPDHGDPGSTITDTDVRNEVVNAINDTNSPILPPSNFGIRPMYIVVTPIGTAIDDSSLPSNDNPGDDRTTIGYHYNDNTSTNYGDFNLVYAWIGNYYLAGLGGQLTNIDSITSPISHEVSEAMTDAEPFSGITCNAGSKLPGGGNNGEIGDYEPEDYNLDEYRVDGVLVQAMWDYNAQAFTVHDPNGQHLDLYANYTHNPDGSYTYTGSTLDVYGDQFSNHDDSITLDTSNGGVQVNLNGEVFTFEAGIDITQIDVLPNGGTNTIQVNNTNANCRVDITGDGIDLVTVGNSTNGVRGINNIVYTYNGYPTHSSTGWSTLTINDGPDGTGRSATINDTDFGGGYHRGYVANLAPGTIEWLDNSSGTYTGGVETVSISGGRGGNTFTVSNDGPLWNGMHLSTGTGSNTVYVQNTTGSLYVDGGSGSQTVNVGNGGSMQGINGVVDVYNGSSNGYSYLYLDDSADTTNRTVNMYDGEITNLAPAAIEWSDNAAGSYYGGVNYVSVKGGSGGNTFNVYNTSPLAYDTYLSSGSGSNRVNVLATTGSLSVDGGSGGQDVFVTTNGSVQGIHGLVDVYNSNSAGYSSLYIEDYADTTAHTVDMYDGSVNGLAPAAIQWSDNRAGTNEGGVAYLQINGSAGASTYNVHNTSPFNTYTLLDTGTSADTVDVYGTAGALYVDNIGGSDSAIVGSDGTAADGTMSNISGDVHFNGAGSTYLYIGDAGDRQARSVSMSDGELAGFSSGTVYWTASAGATGGVTELEVLGGGGGNTYTIYSTSAFRFGTYLNVGVGNDTLYVLATTGGLDEYNNGGNDSVYVGSGGAARNGTMANINGYVYLHGAGATFLYLADLADSIPRNANLYQGELTGLSPANIYWTGSAATTGGVVYLNMSGSSAGSTYTVNNTDALSYFTYLQTGPGNDTVNLQATTGSFSTYNSGGADFVYVGSAGSAMNGTLANIQGAVNVYGAGPSYLYLGDGGDSTARTVSLSSTALTGLSPATISWTPTASATGGIVLVNVVGSGAGSTYTVNNTAALGDFTILQTGIGDDIVNILATTGKLYVYNGGGKDFDYVGATSSTLGSGHTANINGQIYAYGPGATSLDVDDSSDMSGHTVTVSDGITTGLAPAPILWSPTVNSTGGVTSVALLGSDGASTYNVTSTSNFYYYTDIQTGAGADQVNVRATAGGLFVYNRGGADSDVIGSLAPNLGGNLTTINDGMLVYGASGTTTALVVDDSGDATGRAATLTSTALTGMGNPGVIDYDATVKSLTINGPSAGSTFSIQSTASGTTTTINGGAGNDTFNAAVGSLTDLAGHLTIAGGGGSNTVTGPNLTNTWTINATNAGYLSSATKLAFSSIQNLAGGTGNDTFKFTGSAAGLSGTLNGGTGTTSKLDFTGYHAAIHVSLTSINSGTVGPISGGFSNIVSVAGYSTDAVSSSLTGPSSGSALGFTWSLTASNGGKISTISTPVKSFAFTGVGNLTGGSSVDVFKLSAAGKTHHIDGGTGANWLDFSSFSTSAPVSVNLSGATALGVPASSATDVNGGTANGVANVLNARGGAGADVLIGGGGNILVGGSGNDTLMDTYAGVNKAFGGLLIGGAGQDAVTGGKAGDILIGGTTSYDTKNANLQDILTEWDTASSHATAFAALQASGGVGSTGSKLLWGTATGDTVKDDAAVDALARASSPADVDWFFASTSDSTNARHLTDHLNDGLA